MGVGVRRGEPVGTFGRGAKARVTSGHVGRGWCSSPRQRMWV